MVWWSINFHLRKYYSSVRGVLELEKMTKTFIEHINKYKKEKDISIQLYRHQKKELKECIHNLLNTELSNLNEKELRNLFANSIVICRRILISKEEAKNGLMKYISIKKGNISESVSALSREEDLDKGTACSREEIVLIAKYVLYLNIEYDKFLFNYIYMEWNNVIELYTLEELVEIVNLIASFKNKYWINKKFFARCVNEIIIKCTEGSKEKNIKLPIILVSLIKSCTKVDYDIDNIRAVIDLFLENYKRVKKKRDEGGMEMEMEMEEETMKKAEESIEQTTMSYNNNYNIYALVKVLYNLFLSNYYNSKSINSLISLLKEELLPIKEEEEYPSNNKYLFHENLVIDNNLDFNSEWNINSHKTRSVTDSSSTYICNDTINNIHEIYFNSSKKVSNDVSMNTDIVRSLNAYRLKFLDMVIRSDSYLYNLFYSPHSHFWDFIKQLRFEVELPPKETIFIKQVTFFLKENGFQVKWKRENIYQVLFIPVVKKTCVELVHSIFVNKKMKDSPNKFHKNNLNYKIRYLTFLGWNILLFYEHEWKKLRNYDEKYKYVQRILQNIK